MTEYVCGFMYSADLNHVLLIQKARPKWQAGKLNGIGGHLEDCESVYEAMAREFSEETGYAGLHNWTHRVILTVNQNAVVHFFSMTGDLDVEFPLMENKDEPLVKFPMVDTIKRQGELVQSLGWLLPFCADHCVAGASSAIAQVPVHVAYKNPLIPK